jgi:hypothetical protein
VRDDSRIFAQIFDASIIEEQQRLIESMAMQRLLPAWGPLPGSMALLLAYLARAHGRPPSLVGEYLSLFAGDRRPWGPPWRGRWHEPWRLPCLVDAGKWHDHVLHQGDDRMGLTGTLLQIQMTHLYFSVIDNRM